MASFVFHGSSGKGYRYLLVPIDTASVPREAGNYILAAGNATNPKPILVDCADGVRDALQKQMASIHWKTATDIYGVTLLYVHVVDSSEGPASRLREKIDLIEAYRPPMSR